MKRLATRGLALLTLTALVSVAIGACKKTSTASPTTPTPVTTTETFSGSFPQLGSAVHTFTVAANGTMTLTVTSVAPLTTMAIGVGIGSWDGTTCNVISKNDNARPGVTALTGTAVAGNFCSKVYDSGNVPDGWTVTYTIQVVHP
jgi:hypothetical protein